MYSVRKKTAVSSVVAAAVLLAFASKASEAAGDPRIDSTLGSPTILVQENYAVGDTVEVSSIGSWYTAVIIGARSGEYRIHYVGWDASWDEWVKPGRIRSVKKAAPAGSAASTGKSGAAPAKSSGSAASSNAAVKSSGSAAPVTPAGKVWSQRPEGKYSCTTFDAGQLNRIAEITLESGGRYRETVRGGSGRYEYDAKTSRIRFVSGPQKTNAPVTFDPTARSGKGWLMFDYGGGAKLHCYREALK